MLNGERVVLRPIQRGDLPRLWELISDFEVAVLGSSGPVVPRSLAQFEAGFDQDLTKDHNDRAYFGIDVDGELIGEAGLHRIDHFSRVCELGIGIGRDFWGKGFGQDAVRTLVDYAFEHLNMNRVGLYCWRRTPGRRRVPQGRVRRGGQDQAARLVRGRYEGELVMAILREDWTPRT
jgi:RimJ/RimL family protein N-acetyltransferase